jgi:hypothetical protein
MFGLKFDPVLTVAGVLIFLLLVALVIELFRGSGSKKHGFAALKQKYQNILTDPENVQLLKSIAVGYASCLKTLQKQALNEDQNAQRRLQTLKDKAKTYLVQIEKIDWDNIPDKHDLDPIKKMAEDVVFWAEEEKSAEKAEKKEGNNV